MVAKLIFLVAQLLSLFIVILAIISGITFIDTIMIVLAATLAIVQQDIKKKLVYSIMSQLGYMMLILNMRSYEAYLFHLIIHA